MARHGVSRGANPGTDSQFPANCAGNLVSVPGLRRISGQFSPKRLSTPRTIVCPTDWREGATTRVGPFRCATMTSPTNPLRDIETSTLGNGVRVITEIMPHVRSVSVGIWIGSGSRRESTVHNGISHFIEHMLFKGTTSRSAEDIARSVDALGGNLDAFTAKELVCFNTKVMDQHLSQAFDVLADLVLHPMFRDEDIEKEKGVILEEIKMEEDSPDYLVHEIFSANF